MPARFGRREAGEAEGGRSASEQARRRGDERDRRAERASDASARSA